MEPDDQPRDRDPRVTLSRALLEQIIEQAAEAITVADRDGRLIVVNEAARRAAQRRVERPTLDSIRTDWGAFYENGRQIARGEYALQRALHGQSVKDREVELVRDDGTSVDLSISAQPVREADGTIIAAVATFMDITARKRAEAAFRESERRTRAIFDTAYQFEGLLDRRGTLLDANATALGFIGAKLADVVGRPFWETPWWHDLPKSQAQLKAAVAEAAAGRFVRCEMEHRSAAGGVHLFDFSLKPIRDETGQVVLLVPEGRDITERHQIETRLRESEARYRAVFKQAAVGMARVSLAGEFLEVNDRFCAITGYTRQELLAGGFQQITHPDDLAPNLVKSRALLAQGNRFRLTGVGQR